VVADEGGGDLGVEEAVVAGQGPGQLVGVAVVEARPDRLPQLVLGQRVDGGGPGDRGVVAVDDLAEEPRVGVALADAGEDLVSAGSG
jgi:hypothetical protein